MAENNSDQHHFTSNFNEKIQDKVTSELTAMLNDLRAINNEVKLKDDYTTHDNEHLFSNEIEAKRKSNMPNDETVPLRSEYEAITNKADAKAKIIEDLFASSRVSELKFTNDIVDDKTNQTKKRIIDDLFTTERSAHTIHQKEKETERFGNKNYIAPGLIIEEEQNENKNKIEQVRITFNIHQKPQLEVNDTEESDILDRIVSKREKHVDKVADEEEEGLNKEVIDNDKVNGDRSNEDDKKDDSGSRGDEEQHLNVEAKPKLEEFPIEYNTNLSNNEKKKKESSTQLNDFDVEPKSNRILSSIKQAALLSSNRPQSLRQQEISPLTSKQSTKREPMPEQRPSNKEPTQLQSNHANTLIPTMIHREDKGNGIISVKSLINHQNSSKERESDRKRERSLSQRTISITKTSQATSIKAKVIKEAVNPLPLKEANNEDLADSNFPMHCVKKTFPRDFSIAGNISITPNTEIAFKELSSSTKENSDVSNSLLLQCRESFLSHTYFPPLSFQNKPKHKNSTMQSIQTPYNYPRIVLSNYERVQDRFYQLFSLISIEDMTALYNALLKPSRSSNEPATITKVYPREAFIQDFNYSFPLTSNDFGYYRLFKANGDSFYHCLMFSYIEQLLLLKKKAKLLALFLDVLRMGDLNQHLYKNVNLKQSMTFMALMSDLIQFNSYSDAYSLFIASYANEETAHSVGYLLMAYVRYCLFVLLYEKARLKKAKEGRHGAKGGKQPYYEEIVIGNVFKAQMEPSQAVLEMVPSLFYAKLKVCYLEGPIDSAQLKIVEYNKEDTIENCDITISLGYFYSGYNCVYPKALLNSNAIFKEVNRHHIATPSSSDIIMMTNATQCPNCKDSYSLVHFSQYNQSFCDTCLFKCINEALVLRVICLASEYFMNLECKSASFNASSVDYCREISINKEPTIHITNSIVIALYKESIPTLLAKFMRKLCWNCFGPAKKKRQLVTLSCSCQFCFECLKESIKQASNSKMILNRFEVETQLRLPCLCKGLFNYCEAIKLIEGSYLEETQQAKSRMAQVVASKCMKCLVTLLKPSDRHFVQNSATKKLYQRVAVLKVANEHLMNEIDYSESEHLICMKCYRKADYDPNESFKVNQSQDKSLSNTIEKKGKIKGKGIQCSICKLEHIVEKKEWEGIKSSPCLCEKKCLIY